MNLNAEKITFLTSVNENRNEFFLTELINCNQPVFGRDCLKNSF